MKGGPGDPPTRGKGKNAPYLYTIRPNVSLGKYSTFSDTKVNPDNIKAHPNSYFFNESKIPNRFITHYMYAEGSQYDLTPEEYKELGISRPNLRSSEQFQNAPYGKTEGQFIVPGVFTKASGTVGRASCLYNGSLTKNKDGTFFFEGTMNLVDRYDFNWKESFRSGSNKFLTWWGAVSMSGNDFKIVGPTINVKESQNSHSSFPYWKGTTQNGGSRSEENGGKWY